MKCKYLTALFVCGMVTITACGTETSENEPKEIVQAIDTNEIQEDMQSENVFVGTWTIDAEKTADSLKQYSMRDLFGSEFSYDTAILEINDDGTMKYCIGVMTDDGSGTYSIDGNILTYSNLSGEYADEKFEQVESDGEVYLQQNVMDETIYWKVKN